MGEAARGIVVRLDIAVNGFCGGSFERAFFDVRVFNSLAPSNRQQNPAITYKRSRSTAMNNAFMKSNMDPSLPKSCLSQVVWVMLQKSASKGSPPYLLPNNYDNPYSTTLAWMRCIYLTRCYILPSNIGPGCTLSRLAPTSTGQHTSRPGASRGHLNHI